MHFYGFRKGLKTGSYYIHSKPAADAQKVTIDSSIPTKNENEGLDVIEDLESSKESRWSRDAESCPIGCESCGSWKK